METEVAENTMYECGSDNVQPAPVGIQAKVVKRLQGRKATGKLVKGTNAKNNVHRAVISSGKRIAPDSSTGTVQLGPQFGGTQLASFGSV